VLLAICHAARLCRIAARPSRVGPCTQVTDQRLPKTYDYHRVPAPFIQVRSGAHGQLASAARHILVASLLVWHASCYKDKLCM
jgi:hypothetical protein